MNHDVDHPNGDRHSVPNGRYFTVVIPTYKRPEFLRHALDSVRNQSARELVAEVIVSENSDDPRSEELCRSYHDLPMRFVRQTPPIPVGAHFLKLPTLAQTEHVALLGDDDMWGRYHLEEADRLLSLHPRAVGYVGNAVTVRDASRSTTAYQYLIQAGLPPCADRFADHWLWTATDVLLASLIVTPLNMWSIVARRNEICEAMKVFIEPEPGVDSDRYMIWRLACQGDLVVGREVDLYYRVHSDSGCNRYLSEAPLLHRKMAGNYTERMLAEAAERGIDAHALWHDMVAKMTPEQWKEIRLARCNLRGAIDALEAAWGADAMTQTPRGERAKAFVQDCLPPIVYRALARAKRLVARKQG